MVPFRNRAKVSVSPSGDWQDLDFKQAKRQAAEALNVRRFSVYWMETFAPPLVQGECRSTHFRFHLKTRPVVHGLGFPSRAAEIVARPNQAEPPTGPQVL